MRSEFIIKDVGTEGAAALHVTWYETAATVSTFHATAVYVPAEKFSTMVRLNDDLRAAQHRKLTGWLYSLYSHAPRIHLFASINDEGEDTKRLVELKLRQMCRPLTLDQKSAD